MKTKYELKIGYQNVGEYKGCSGKTKVLQKIIHASSLRLAKSKATNILKEVVKKDERMLKYRDVGWGGWCESIEYESNCFFVNRTSDPVDKPAFYINKNFAPKEEQHPGTFALCQLTWDERQQALFEEEIK